MNRHPVFRIQYENIHLRDSPHPAAAERGQGGHEVSGVGVGESCWVYFHVGYEKLDMNLNKYTYNININYTYIYMC